MNEPKSTPPVHAICEVCGEYEHQCSCVASKRVWIEQDRLSLQNQILREALEVFTQYAIAREALSLVPDTKEWVRKEELVKASSARDKKWMAGLDEIFGENDWGASISDPSPDTVERKWHEASRELSSLRAENERLKDQYEMNLHNRLGLQQDVSVLRAKLAQCEADLLAPADWREKVGNTVKEWDELRAKLAEAEKQRDEAQKALIHHQEITGSICLPTDVPQSYSSIKSEHDKAIARVAEVEKERDAQEKKDREQFYAMSDRKDSIAYDLTVAVTQIDELQASLAESQRTLDEIRLLKDSAVEVIIEKNKSLAESQARVKVLEDVLKEVRTRIYVRHLVGLEQVDDAVTIISEILSTTPPVQ